MKSEISRPKILAWAQLPCGNHDLVHLLGFNQNVRNLNDSDFEALQQAGITLIRPAAPNKTTTQILPTFESQTQSGRFTHVKFAWIGQDENATSRRAHWGKVIEMAQKVGEVSWLETLVAAVDLGDMCAVVVEPTTSLMDFLAHKTIESSELKSYVAELALALMKLGQIGITVLALGPEDVVIDEHNTISLSCSSEFCWEPLKDREKRSTGIELVIKYLLQVEDLHPSLGPQVQDIRGTALAVMESAGDSAALGQFVLALKNKSSHSEVKTQTSSQKTWQRPEITPKKQTAKLILIGASTTVILGLSLFFWNNHLSSTPNASHSAPEQETAKETPVNLVEPNTPDSGDTAQRAVKGSQITDDSNSQAVQAAHDLLLKRAQLFELPSKEITKQKLEEVYVDVELGKAAIVNTVSELERQNAKIINSQVEVTANKVLESDEETLVKIELEYQLIYEILQQGKSHSKKETEKLLLDLRKIENQWKIAYVE